MVETPSFPIKNFPKKSFFWPKYKNREMNREEEVNLPVENKS